MANEVTIVVKARDEGASTTIGGAAQKFDGLGRSVRGADGRLRDAKGRFVALGDAAKRSGTDVGGLGDRFSDTDRKSSGLRGRLAGIGSAIKGAAAGAAAFGAVKMFGTFINDANESAKVGAMTEQVIKSTGGAANVTADQVGNLATAISGFTGVDDEAIQSAENLLLTFTNVRNAAGKGNDVFNRATQTIVDMTAAMNGGHVSAEALKDTTIQVGKALNDPIKGMTALSRVGVTFDATTKRNVRSLILQGKTLEAQKIVLKELNREFGGSAKASATAMDQFKVSVGNMSESIGGKLLPAVNDVLFGLQHLGSLGVATQGLWDKVTGGTPKVAMFQKTLTGTDDAAQKLKSSVGDLSEAMRSLSDENSDALGTQIAFEEAIDKASESIKENGHTLDVHTEKGRANMKALKDIRDAAMAYRDKLEESGQDSTKVMVRARASFIHTAEAMGATKKRAEELANSLGLIPPKANAADRALRNAARERKMKMNISQWSSAISAAKSRLNSVPKSRQASLRANIRDLEGKVSLARKLLASLHDRSVHVNVNYRNYYAPGFEHGPGRASGGIIGAQGGGPRSRLTLVGENGPELADLAPGTTVHSNADSRRMLAQGGGGQPIVVQLILDGKQIAEATFDHTKGIVRNRGGKGAGSAQKAWGY
jgi:acid phosphatase family membrane protein YuiD